MRKIFKEDKTILKARTNLENALPKILNKKCVSIY